jgi:hypothetical protein
MIVMAYYNFDAEIFLDGIETPFPVRLRGQGGADVFDQEHSDHIKGGVFEPVTGTDIPDFLQKNVTLVTKTKGSLLPKTYILECVSRTREGWMFEAAIKQNSN